MSDAFDRGSAGRFPASDEVDEHAAENGETTETDADAPERDPLDQAHQRVDGQVADDGARGECDRRHRGLDRRHAAVDGRDHPRAERRRDRKQKGEPKRGGAVVATEEQRARGRPRARDARQDREPLKHADQHRVHEIGRPPPATSSFDPALDESSDDQQSADQRHERAAGELAHEFLQEEQGRDPDDRGHERGDREKGELRALTIEGVLGSPVRQRADERRDLPPVVAERRERGSGVEEQRELDRDPRIDVLDHREIERDVSLAGDGEPLEDSLEDTDDDRQHHRPVHGDRARAPDKGGSIPRSRAGS